VPLLLPPLLLLLLLLVAPLLLLLLLLLPLAGGSPAGVTATVPLPQAVRTASSSELRTT
jgi:hypothetical protein